VGGRQVVRPRTLDPVSKVRILPAQPVFSCWPKEHYQVRFQAPFKSERRPHFIGRRDRAPTVAKTVGKE
jgi:hypothetical protein